MTLSLSPLRGALRVFSIAAIAGAAGITALPAQAAGNSIHDALKEAVRQSANRDGRKQPTRISDSRRPDSRSDSRRSDRGDRSRSRDSRSDRSDRSRHSSRDRDRHDRHDSHSRHSSSRYTSGRHDSRYTGYRSSSHRSPYSHSRSNRYTSYRPSYYSSPYRSSSNYHRTNYRSGLGISFSFGTPGYSSQRWAPSRYSFYQPAYGGYSAYSSQTTCRPVRVQALHHGHYETVEVTQCSNPWDGTYIIQGSERIVNCLY